MVYNGQIALIFKLSGLPTEPNDVADVWVDSNMLHVKDILTPIALVWNFGSLFMFTSYRYVVFHAVLTLFVCGIGSMLADERNTAARNNWNRALAQLAAPAHTGVDSASARAVQSEDNEHPQV